MGTANSPRRGLAPHEIQALIDAARGGDVESLGRLLEHYRWYLLQTAQGELPDDLRAKVAPSDVVQETFLQVQHGILLFRGQSEEELRAWLRQIVLNTVGQAGRRYRRTEKRDLSREVPLATDRHSADHDHLLPATYETPSQYALANERARRVATAFEKLPDQYQQVIALRNNERLSFVQIGDEMKKSAAAARQMWLRAVKQLRQELSRGNDSL